MRDTQGDRGHERHTGRWGEGGTHREIGGMRDTQGDGGEIGGMRDTQGDGGGRGVRSNTLPCPEPSAAAHVCPLT